MRKSVFMVGAAGFELATPCTPCNIFYVRGTRIVVLGSRHSLSNQ